MTFDYSRAVRPVPPDPPIRSAITPAVTIGAAFFLLNAVAIRWVAVGIISNLVNEISFLAVGKVRFDNNSVAVGDSSLGWVEWP